MPDPTQAATPQAKSTTTPTSSAVGLVVGGRYRIMKPLAAGGMGSVYLAEQLDLQRSVAVKRVTSPDAESAERFRREAIALAAVSHPAIVEIHDFVTVETDEDAYLIMAYVEGEDLADYLDTVPDGRLATIDAVELSLPIASALVELHTRSIIHRDIKPANLVRFLRADGRPGVKLVDFGIARRQDDPGLTAEGLIVGTPSYLAPEVMLGKKHSPASDVYAFGATLFELLAGAPPYGRDDIHLIMKRTISEPVTLPPPLRDTELGRLLLAMLDGDDERRPGAQQTLETLETIRFELAREGTAPRPARAPTVATIQLSNAASTPTAGQTAPVTRSPRPGSNRRVVIAYATAALSLLIALAVTLFFSLRKPDSPPRQKSEPPPPAAAAEAPDPAGQKRAAPMPARPMPARQAPSLDLDPIRRKCTNVNQAYRLFMEASRLYRAGRRLEFVEKVFHVILETPLAKLNWKYWSARRLGNLYVKRKACGRARVLWRRYESYAQQKGVKPLPFPACPQ